MIQFDGQPWAPTTFTPPLRGELVLSDGPRLIELMEHHWRLPTGNLVTLRDDQRATINHLLERYPLDWPVPGLRGRLRFRQAVASMGRQNGKSVIGGGIGLYGLTQHVEDPSVVGVATSVEQANVVYDRVRYAVVSDPLLTSLMIASGTRGIRWRDGRGGYQVKPNLREGLQSVPVTLGIADELHLMRPEMWYSIVNGQRSRLDALVIGITTAGDDGSHLLKDLSARGYAAIQSPHLDERFGFWLWTAPDGATIHDPGALEAANPAIAIGAIDRETVLADIAASPVTDQQRYALNQFVAASRSWADLDMWDQCPTTDPDGPTTQTVVFGVDRSSGWDWITITAAWKHDGIIHTEPVASLRGVGRDQLIELLTRLLEHHPDAAIAMDSRRLSDVGKQLRDQGREVWMLTSTEAAQAAAGIYARITRGTLAHTHTPILRRQLATSHQKRLNDGSWLVVPGPTPADAIIATFLAAHISDINDGTPSQQLFV